MQLLSVLPQKASAWRWNTLQHFLPVVVWLENVKELLETSEGGESDMGYVVEQLRDLGYFARLTTLTQHCTDPRPVANGCTFWL